MKRGDYLGMRVRLLKDMFGSDALARLDAIRYDDDEEVSNDGE